MCAADMPRSQAESRGKQATTNNQQGTEGLIGTPGTRDATVGRSRKGRVWIRSSMWELARGCARARRNRGTGRN
eukprot:11215635-Lingulodinium_polyedra.AAC.1